MDTNHFINAREEALKIKIVSLKEELKKLGGHKKTVATKNGVETWLGFEFESSSGLTAEFQQFSNDFKKHIKKSLPNGSQLVNFSRGHFYVSGFINRGKKFVYFSISDIRHFPDSWYKNILIRTAENYTDYTGGRNCSTTIPDFKREVDCLLEG